MKRPRTATDGTAHYRDTFSFITRHWAAFDPSPEPCHVCGDFHPGLACAESLVVPPTTCERQPANGPYIGPCAVRTIEPELTKAPPADLRLAPGTRIRREDDDEVLTVRWCGVRWAVLIRADGSRVACRLATVIKSYEVAR